MSIINLTSTELRKAADLQDKIASLQKELAALTGNATSATPAKPAKPAKKKGGMRAAGRAKIAAAQKARWAKVKAAKPAAKAVVKSVPAKPSQSAKRTISPGHIAKIKAAQKLRWAKFHAAKAKTTAKPDVKKIVVVAAPSAKPVAKPVAKKKK